MYTFKGWAQIRTHEDMAVIAGVSRAHITSIATGSRKPSTEVLARLHARLGSAFDLEGTFRELHPATYTEAESILAARSVGGA